jgi:hypothetical protein
MTMLEDFRGHDPDPTVHERAWMETNPFPVVVRLVALAGISVIIGVTLSQTLEPEHLPVPAAVASAPSQ